MMTDDDQLISRSLDTLAQHAPTYRGLAHPTARPSRHRHLAPLLASACVVAITVTAAVVLSQGVPQDGVATSPNADATSSTAPTAPPSRSTTEFPVRLEAAASWSHLDVPDCVSWVPTAEDSVVQLESLRDTCIINAPSSVTTVFVAPYEGSALFGSGWDEVTTPWRTIDGRRVTRLSSGPLMEMSSRLVDAVVCASCDQVIVVVGPDPSTVRGLIESATG